MSENETTSFSVSGSYSFDLWHMDIRWLQRLDNYSKALIKLGEAISLIKEKCFDHGILVVDQLTTQDEIIIEGLIQRFEYTHEPVSKAHIGWGLILTLP